MSEFCPKLQNLPKVTKKSHFRGFRGQNRNLCEKCFIVQWFLPQTELSGPCFEFPGSQLSGSVWSSPHFPVRSGPLFFPGPEFPVRSSPVFFPGPDFPVWSGPVHFCRSGISGPVRSGDFFRSGISGPVRSGDEKALKSCVSEVLVARIRICAKNAS